MQKMFLPYLILISSGAPCQFTTKKVIEWSKNVNDSFAIYISLPNNYNRNSNYNVVYYCDADLKSGEAIRRFLLSSSYDLKLKNYIFVGIGQKGNYHVLRRRDFIPPYINGKDTISKNSSYGHIENFYGFLKQELIPLINSRYPVNADSNSIIGHSLGGLFVFYCLFKNENLFSKYFALSPALWIDNYSIYRFNKITNGLIKPEFIYFASGGNEKMNRILKGTNDAKRFFDTEKYTKLQYLYEIHAGKAHNSEVPVSLTKILNDLL